MPYFDIKTADWMLETFVTEGCAVNKAGMILGLRPANERRRYKVTPSHIGWAQT